jgi:hypothetical protein
MGKCGKTRFWMLKCLQNSNTSLKQDIKLFKRGSFGMESDKDVE